MIFENEWLLKKIAFYLTLQEVANFQILNTITARLLADLMKEKYYDKKIQHFERLGKDRDEYHHLQLQTPKDGTLTLSGPDLHNGRLSTVQDYFCREGRSYIYSNKKVHTLKIGKWSLKDGYFYIQRFLKSNPKLDVLDLSNTDLTDNMLHKIIDTVKFYNTHLKSIILDQNPQLDITLVKNFQNHLKNRSCIDVDIRSNEQRKSAKKIQGAWRNFSNKRHSSATVIQSFWRGYYCREVYPTQIYKDLVMIDKENDQLNLEPILKKIQEAIQAKQYVTAYQFIENAEEEINDNCSSDGCTIS